MLLVTDSQSSIDIMDSMDSMIGIGRTLQSEMDVALELNTQRAVQWWIQRNIQKVQSHVPIEEALDEFY